MKNVAINSPEWLTRGAVYQINPRTFNEKGTISAITEELPVLAKMGFRILYLCPIFEEDENTNLENISPRQKKSNTNNPKNPYRMNDYFRIDSEYGTAEDLKELVDKAHEMGVKVLLDVVYAHIGPSAPIIQKHPEFVEQNPDGSFVYTEWNFPKLDFRCEGLREYLYANMMYYISAFDVDGFRCDVGDMVPIDFWKEAHRRMQAVKPDAVLINEGATLEWLAITFNVSYCFAWHDALHKVFCKDTPATALREAYEARAKTLPKNGLLLRDIDTHDTVTDWPQRVEIAATHDGMEQIEVINYMIDGVPMVYCGNELACTAKLNMFANRFYMGEFETTNRTDLQGEACRRRMALMTKLNEMKRESDVLCHGETVWLDMGEGEAVVAFKRVYDGEEILFIGNAKPQQQTLELPDLPVNARVILENKAEKAANTLTLQPYGYVVYEVKKV